MSSPSSYIFAFSLCSAAACVFDGDNKSTNSGVTIDATVIDATNGPDGMTSIDASLSETPHLLISEIRNRDGGREFIEIYNPGDSAVSLDNYYLADNGAYINLAAATLNPDAFRPEQGADFVVRFPPNNTILGKGVVVVGIGLKVIDDVPPITAQFHLAPDGIDGVEMLAAYRGSIRGTPTLTNSGEGVILFHWDGVSNLVSDVDIVVAGNNPAPGNLPPNKTGQSVTGPSTTSTYAPDLALFPPSANKLQDEESYQRIALEGDDEKQDGNGNGITGHDETSEDTTMTWTIRDMTPGTTDL